MRALSVKQPWLYAITHLSKRIENRTWKPPASIIGKRIVLHASKGSDTKEAYRIVESLAVANIPDDLPMGCILATAIVEGYTEKSDDIWFAGPYGWLLSDVELLPEPIPFRGALGLWPVGDDDADLCEQMTDEMADLGERF